MTHAFQPVRLRRALYAGAAALLLHYLAATWIGSGAASPPVRAPVAVTLRAAPLPPPPVEAGAAVPARPVQSGGSSGARSRADPPPSARLTFALVRAAATGPATSAEAVLDWERDRAAYRLHYAGLVEMASAGRIGKAGIIPVTMTEQRRGRARTATHFAERGTITFSASERSVAMQAGAQDRATWPLQLAALARARGVRTGAGITLQVGEEKDASDYRFVVLGREDIVTGMGTLGTWRLARLAPPGTYNTRLDIWLAPGRQWYPVQLRSTEANGTVTTQTIRAIVVKDAGN
jgi:hypothetical protein